MIYYLSLFERTEGTVSVHYWKKRKIWYICCHGVVDRQLEIVPEPPGKNSNIVLSQNNTKRAYTFP